MREASCARESAVARAVRSGDWNPSLEMHVRECTACREVRDAARWMQALMVEPQAQSDELPDARILWLRAQIAARDAAAERAQTIAHWVEIASAMSVCMAAAVWLAWNWGAVGDALGSALDWVRVDTWPAFWSGLNAYGLVSAPVLFSLALAVIAAVTLSLAYPLLASE